MATEAIQRSQALLKDVESSIQETLATQKDIHKCVNDGLTKKVSETVSMKVREYILHVLFCSFNILTFVQILNLLF